MPLPLIRLPPLVFALRHRDYYASRFIDCRCRYFRHADIHDRFRLSLLCCRHADASAHTARAPLIRRR